MSELPQNASAGTPFPRTEDEDARLMLRVAAGDARAMRPLVEKWQKPLINFFCRSVNSVHTAEDLAQNFFCRSVNSVHTAEDLAQTTFVKIYRAAGTYEAKAKFSSWLFLVARSVLISNFRKESLRPADATDPVELRAVSDEDDALRLRDLEAAFAFAVRSLPENHRTAILLLRQQEFSYEEIAVAMGASLQTVKTWIFRARRELREKLADFLEK